MKRAFDLIFGIIGLLLLSPLFLLVSILIVIDNGFPVFFVQKRVGKDLREFGLVKFRSMRKLRNDEADIQITIGKNNRITRIGTFLRYYKIDELPQLINIVRGHMSFVGPRPEVPRYVVLYSREQLKVLSVKPGLTDYASIKYRDESQLLASNTDPEKYYVEKIMPDKLRMNLEYVSNHSFWKDILLIQKTIRVILLFKKKSI